MSFTVISELNPSRFPCRIQVKVIRKFKHCFENKVILDLVLADDKGEKIHASLPREFIYPFYSEVEEGDSVVLDGFGLIPATGDLRPTLHDFKVLWNSSTSFVKIPSITDDNYFGFVEFGDVHAGLRDPTFYVDLIGHIAVVGTFTHSCPTFDQDWGEVYLELRNESDVRLQLVMRNDIAFKIVTSLSRSRHKVNICVVRFARIFEVRDGWKAMTMYNCTQILLNPELPEVRRMRATIIRTS